MASNCPLAGRFLFAACILLTGYEAAAAQGAPPPAVTVTPVASREVTATGDFIGRVVAIDKVDVVARVSGFINERNFSEGQQVKTGDLLFSIEPDTYKAAVDQQNANLAKAKATEVNANLQLQRGQDLVRNQNIPQSEVDQRAANAQAAHADVMQAQALLEQARINLGYTEIRSPVDGRIGLANFTVGNLVSPSSGPLATIVSQDPMWVTFPVSQRDFLTLKVNPKDLKVKIRFADGTTYNQVGTINFIDVSVDRATDTVLVRATMPNPDGALIDGQLVTVVLETEQPQEKVTVPQAALIADQEGTYVFVVDDGKAAIRRIKPGGEIGPDVIVNDGLKGGEQVIVEGIQSVRPGQPVQAAPMPANLKSG